MENLKLVVPSHEDLIYRQRLLSYPLTMSFNRGLDLDFAGYDKKTGCLDFSPSKWSRWYNTWINNEPDRYYAYLGVESYQNPIGEVALRFDQANNTHIISLIIEAKHRGKGYGEQGLHLLLEKAFYDLDLEKVADQFPESRTASYRLFKQMGFEIVKTKDDILCFELLRDNYPGKKNFHI
ncbi:MAG: GNAT family N-acetyltransferase [Candidatus Cloacimonadales bacterium]